VTIWDSLMTIMTPADAAALAFFIIVMAGYRIVSKAPSIEARSLVGAVQRQRITWLLVMAARENRVLDAIVLQSLGQGNAFFASTTAIAIGGLTALLGSGERAQSILERIPYVAKSGTLLWEIKLLLIVAIFIFAFFKFAWAFRLSHYAAIMIGATPVMTETNSEACNEHSVRTARLVGIAAEHANGGIRAFYYAIAALAWFFHPLAFAIATLWVMVILVRRDFFSRSLRLIAGP
jgi:uncharacterized membrane protein